MSNRRYNSKKAPVQLTVIFPRPLHDFIESEASRLGISRNEFIRQCVIRYAKMSECDNPSIKDKILKY